MYARLLLVALVTMSLGCEGTLIAPSAPSPSSTLSPPEEPRGSTESREEEPVSAPQPAGLQDASGLDVFAARCAGCHGAEGEGTDRAPQLRFEAPDYASWVVRNGRVSTEFPVDMPVFDDVSDEQLEEILDWLSSFPAPTDGHGLYARYCGNCHGPDASGGVVGVDLWDDTIDTDQVREGSGGSSFGSRRIFMPAWDVATISEGQLASIADYLAALEKPED